MRNLWKVYYVFAGVGVVLMFTAAGANSSILGTLGRCFVFTAICMLPFIFAGGIPTIPRPISRIFSVRNGFIVGGVLFFGSGILNDFGIHNPIIGPIELLFVVCAIILFFRRITGRPQ